MSSRISLPAALLLAVSAAGASAQTPARVHAGAGLSVNLLVGDASDFLDGGAGRSLQGDFRITDDPRFHVRVDADLIGLDDHDGPGSLVAEHDLLAAALGPQLTLPVGRWRPYAGILFGTGVVWRSVDGGFAAEEVDYGEEDGAFAWGGFAGLGFVLDEGDHPVGIRVEARVLDVGPVAFARLTDLSNPQRPFEVVHQDFALLGLRVGMTLGF